ncbi:MAG TPA: hypothetical protein VKR23_04225 [Gaiellaceae bacterium]|nr:hypothetical protein [Gaiellaceae bacterium]
MSSSHAMERGPSGWLQHRRVRIATWIAAGEGLIVLFSHDITKWTVIVLAVVGVVAFLGGRESRSSIVRNVLWIFAASQLLAVILVILAWVVKWALILAIVVLAVAGLVYLFSERK